MFLNKNTFQCYTFVSINMRNFTLILVLVFASLAFGQTSVTLPKPIAKNWIYIPSHDFKSNGIEGNDSVNFVKSCHKIKTDAFFVYNKEISNQEYREFINSVKNSSMLPDTNSWNTDFEFAFNDPMRQYYFSHPRYEDYPVVGISQNQALAYCQWLQGNINKDLAAAGKYNGYVCLVSLPTDKQWESVFHFSYFQATDSNWKAAWVIRERLIKTKENYNLNFGVDLTKEGAELNYYSIDGGLYPVGYKMYKPTKHGIYNLLGNVAEWTLSPVYNHTDSSKVFFKTETKQVIEYLKCNGKEFYDTARSYDYYNDPYNLKPIYEKDGYIAVKGGSWCHSTFYLQPGVSLFCKPNEQHSYIGFRPVMTLVRK